MGESVSISEKKSDSAKEDRTSQTQKSNYSQPVNSSVDRILFLQRTIGNQAVGRLIKSGALQAKLRIGQPDDIYEQEADRVAEQVMRMPERQIVSGNNFHIQRACPKCEENELKRQPIKEEEEEKLQRKTKEEEDEEKLSRQPEEDKGGKLQAKTDSDFNHEVNPGIENQIQSIKGGGHPLSEGERAFFEPRFGADFSQVQVHTDAQAAEAARLVNALAFTMGHDVVFGKGQYAPETGEGRRLLAHELTHVVQQTDDLKVKRFSLLPDIQMKYAAYEAEKLQRSIFISLTPELVQREDDIDSDLKNQGSEAGTTIVPETTIVATPPASMRGWIGRMDYYIERHYDFTTRADPGERPPKYYLGYGNKYVTKFRTVLRPNLSPSGKAWLDCTLIALQTAIEDRRDANPWAFAELERDNDKFQDFAYGTHSYAYVSCGVCDLSIVDMANIANTPDYLDILTIGGLYQIMDTFIRCQPSWFYPVGPAEEGIQRQTCAVSDTVALENAAPIISRSVQQVMRQDVDESSDAGSDAGLMDASLTAEVTASDDGTDDAQRIAIVDQAASEATGLVHAKKLGEPDETGKKTRQGWEQLMNYFYLAAPGIWSDDLIKYGNKVGNGGMPHWCGIFALWALKSSGMSVGTWKMGGGISSVANIKKVSKSSVKIGDVGYMNQPWMHHFIVSDISKDRKTIWSIDGNSGTDSEITTGNKRNINATDSFYSVF